MKKYTTTIIIASMGLAQLLSFAYDVVIKGFPTHAYDELLLLSFLAFLIPFVTYGIYNHKIRNPALLVNPFVYALVLYSIYMQSQYLEKISSDPIYIVFLILTALSSVTCFFMGVRYYEIINWQQVINSIADAMDKTQKTLKGLKEKQQVNKVSNNTNTVNLTENAEQVMEMPKTVKRVKVYY